MKLRGYSYIFCIFFSILATLPMMGTAQAASKSDHKFCEKWCAVVSPRPRGAISSSLTAVTTISPGNAWAVGSYYTKQNTAQTLIVHWNGFFWVIVPSPNVGANNNYLTAVSAIANDDVWAVGSSNGIGQSLIEHWDGKRWSIVVSPDPGGFENYLDAITTISANDVWAVGFSANFDDSDRTLVEHWDGSKWSVVNSPNLGTPDIFNYLLGITAVSKNDIWAVGGYAGDPVSGLTLVEHWDGKIWTTVNTPTLKNSTVYSNLTAISAVSKNDIWTVGVYDSGDNTDQTLIEHWDGSKWSVVDSPNSALAFNNLTGITSINPDNVWSVGYSATTADTTTAGKTLIEHWNGREWNIVQSPDKGSNLNALTGIAASTSHSIWAVGYSYLDASNSQPLIVGYRQDSW